MRMLSLALALALTGCGDAHAPACEVRAWYADGDSDGFGDPDVTELICGAQPGFVSSAGDCDDRDGAVHPGGDEVCNGVDDDCDDEIDEGLVVERFLDRDGDGWGDEQTAQTTCVSEVSLVLQAGDCDDLDPRTYPAAPEICDQRDNDCDGTADDGLGDRWYLDLDEDGFGAPGSGQRICAPWPGAVANGDDCDDTDPARFPGAAEVCGFEDDDCDGEIDEDPADGLAWYLDGDGDGYGDEGGTPRIACVGLPGEVLDATDCLDDDPSVNPAAAEQCDGFDHDCDGLLRDADPDIDPAAVAPYHADLDGDGFGAGPAVGVACEAPPGHSMDPSDCDDGDPGLGPPFGYYADLDGDGFGIGAALGPVCTLPPDAAIDAGDCDDNDPSTFPLAPEVCDDAIDQDCDGRDPRCHPTLAGTMPLGSVGVGLTAVGFQDRAGFSVAGMGDTDGDGFDDVLVGGPEASGGNGAAWLVPGPIDLATPLSWGEAFPGGGSDSAGYAVAPGGDLDGDGLADLLIGGTGWNGAGAVWVLPGPSVGGPLLNVTTRLEGVGGSATGATVLAPGDLDGDGVPDLVVGSPDTSTLMDVFCGQVAVMPGPFVGAASISAAPATWTGATDNDAVGSTLASAGDTDGDGVSELWLGAPDVGGDGEAYLVSYAAGAFDLSGWPVVMDGQTGDRFGEALLGAVDLDGDGYDDLVGGAAATDPTGIDSGTVHVFLGPFAGVRPTFAADAILQGTFPGERAGTSLAYVWGDLAIGAPASDGFGLVAASGPGRVYLVPPPLAGTQSLGNAARAILEGDTFGDAVGYSLASAGDADRDGEEDLLVGAPLDGGGVAWIVYGP